MHILLRLLVISVVVDHCDDRAEPSRGDWQPTRQCVDGRVTMGLASSRVHRPNVWASALRR